MQIECKFARALVLFLASCLTRGFVLFSSDQVFVVVFSSAYLIRKYVSTNTSGREAHHHGSSRIADDSISLDSDPHSYEGSRDGAGSHVRGGNYDEHTSATAGDLGRTVERDSEVRRGRTQYKPATFRTVSILETRHKPEPKTHCQRNNPMCVSSWDECVEVCNFSSRINTGQAGLFAFHPPFPPNRNAISRS